MTIFRYALLRCARSPASLIINAALPLLIVFLPTMWESESLPGLFLIGLMVMFSAMPMARNFLNDRVSGVLTRVLSGPTSSRKYLAQTLLAYSIPIILPLWLIVGVGAVRHGWELDFALWLALSYAVYAAATVGFALAWSCLFRNNETSMSIMGVFISVIAVLSGLMIPLENLPGVLAYVGAIFPAYWASTAITNLRDYGVNLMYWVSLGAMVLFTVAFVLFGGKRRIA